MKSAVEDRTRVRVARTILESGPTTAAVPADGLGLTQAAVRRHLHALLAGGLIEGRSRASARPSVAAVRPGSSA